MFIALILPPKLAPTLPAVLNEVYSLSAAPATAPKTVPNMPPTTGMLLNVAAAPEKLLPMPANDDITLVSLITESLAVLPNCSSLSMANTVACSDFRASSWARLF